MGSGSPLANSVVLGLDVGTSRTKVLALDEEGAQVGARVIATPWRRRQGEDELDAQDLLRSVEQMIDGVVADVGHPRVLAIGIASIAETGFLCDQRGGPLTRGIPWFSPIGTDAALDLAEHVGEDGFAGITGLAVSATPTAMKVATMARRTAGSGAVVWLNVAEWLARALGGDVIGEYSLASRTGWLDVATRRAHPGVLEWIGLGDIVPPLVWAGEPTGVADETIPALRGAVITIAGHDHLCAAIGVGATAEGDLLNSFGTAEAFIGSTTADITPGALGALVADGLESGLHVIRDRRSVIAGTRWGSTLGTVLEILGADSVEAIEGDLPMPTVDAASVSIDIERLALDLGSSAPGRAEIWAAAVAAAHADSLTAFGLVRRAIDGPLRIRGTGGWLRSSWISTLKTRDLPSFRVSPVDESAARGAAHLAGAAAGRWETAVAGSRANAVTPHEG